MNYIKMEDFIQKISELAEKDGIKSIVDGDIATYFAKVILFDLDHYAAKFVDPNKIKNMSNTDIQDLYFELRNMLHESSKSKGKHESRNK